MNELEQQYGGEIDFLRYDLTIAENACEYNRHEWTEGTIPAIRYIDKDGNDVEYSEIVLDRSELEAKLKNLLSQ